MRFRTFNHEHQAYPAAGQPRSRRLLMASLVAPLLLQAAGVARAQTQVYDPGLPGCSGAFIDTNCWVSGVVAGPGDEARFLDPGAYTVNFSTGITNDAVVVRDGSTTFDLNLNTYTLTRLRSAGPGLVIADIGSNPTSLDLTQGTLSADEVVLAQGFGTDGTLNILSGGILEVTERILVGSFGDGSLQISNGGQLIQTNAVSASGLGINPGSSGTALVTGAGSTWSSVGAVIIGSVGTGNLTVEAGGVFNTGNGSIGSQSGSLGTVTITGAGSQWNNTGSGVSSLTVGGSGTGVLSIADGGAYTGDDTRVGAFSGGTGILSVDGAGATLTDTGDLTIGDSGNGNVAVRNGASAFITDLVILGTSGTGIGALDIESGGYLSSGGSLVIGSTTGSSGSVNVTGPGSQLQVGGSIGVGSDGNGTLGVYDGASVSTDGALRVGIFALGSGEVIVDGANTSVSVTEELALGVNTAVNMDILNGASVTAGNLEIGDASTLLISDTGSSLVTAGGIGGIAAGSAQAQITVSGGGLLQNAGSNFDFDSTIAVDGPGSQWNNNGSLNLQNSRLTVTGGGVVTSTFTTMNGNVNGGLASAISGGGSSLQTGFLSIGDDAITNLQIENGGSLVTTGSTMGDGSTGEGHIVVTGTGSNWTGTGFTVAGFDGFGGISAMAGGSVDLDELDIGAFSGSLGAVLVDGVGSSFTANSVEVGGSGGFAGGSASFAVNNGATATVGALDLYTAGILNLNGGTLQATDLDIANGTVNFTEGVVIVDAGLLTTTTNFSLSGALPQEVRLQNGAAWALDLLETDNAGATVDVRSGATLASTTAINVIDGELSASGVGTTVIALDVLTAGFNSGNGQVSITDGAVVDSAGAFLGYSGSVGAVTIDGAGSAWHSSQGDVEIGFGGTGSVGVHGGGTFTVDSGSQTSLGSAVGGTGSLVVTGAGSAFVGGFTMVGETADGSMIVSDGGSALVDGLNLGLSSGSAGLLTVDGSGSNLHSTSNIDVASFGAGSVNVTNGGSITGIDTNAFRIGRFNEVSGVGSLVVDGNGSAVSGFQSVEVGYSAQGTAAVTNGGSIAAVDLVVGTVGDGLLSIESGSSVTVSSADIGRFVGTNGVIDVTGAGSLLSIANDLDVGGSSPSIAGGTALMTVNNGATVDVGDQMTIHALGTVTLNGGTLNAGAIVSSGVLNFNAGALNLTNSGLAVESGGLLGSAVSLSPLKSLGVSGTTTLNGAATLSIDGGTFSTGALVDNGGFAFNSGTFNLTNDDLVIGSGGLFGGVAQFGLNQEINVSNSATVDSGSVLLLANGSFSAGTTTNNGTVVLDGFVATLGGGTLTNNGLLTGNGRVTATTDNTATGEVRVSSGDTLGLSGAGNSHSNSGSINLLGGTLDVDGDLTNTSAGVIAGRGTLIAAGGLNNQGSIALSSGTTDVFGDVSNDIGGSIIVSGNGTATFFDNVVHNGSEIRVSSGSSAVFFGAVSGAGSYTGSGDLFFEGDLNPGNSPGLVSVEGNMSLGNGAYTAIEIGGLLRGTEYDAFDVGGDLKLGGILEVFALEVELAAIQALEESVFSLGLGDSFDLFTAESIYGDFDQVVFAPLREGLTWETLLIEDAMGTTDIFRLNVTTSVVPVPAAVWFMGSGLFCLFLAARRKRRMA